MTNTTSTIFGFVYRNILKPVLFKFDPETVHNTFTALGEFAGSNSWLIFLTKAVFAYSSPSLVKTLNGITFPNPIGLSAGFDYNGQLTDILPAVGFGWHTIGTVTLNPYEGNTKPRLRRLPNSKALIVNKGLKNWGAEKIIQHLETKKITIPTGISIASTNMHFNSLKEQLIDIAQCFQLFEQSSVGHSYYELNISCPNTFGGEPFTNPDKLNLLLTVIDNLSLSKPLYLKMPIDQSENETLKLLNCANTHNVQGIIFGNLTKDHNNPAVTAKDKETWNSAKGNLSGKPTWERSNKLLALAKQQFPSRFTYIGTGGVFSEKDAATKFEKGADLVQLITGMIYQGPQLIGQITSSLR